MLSNSVKQTVTEIRHAGRIYKYLAVARSMKTVYETIFKYFLTPSAICWCSGKIRGNSKRLFRKAYFLQVQRTERDVGVMCKMALMYLFLFRFDVQIYVALRYILETKTTKY